MAKLENNIKNILNRNTVHNNIELKFVSFLTLEILESKGSFSNLGQGNAKYLVVKIKDTLSMIF